MASFTQNHLHQLHGCAALDILACIAVNNMQMMMASRMLPNQAMIARNVYMQSPLHCSVLKMGDQHSKFLTQRLTFRKLFEEAHDGRTTQ